MFCTKNKTLSFNCNANYFCRVSLASFNFQRTHITLNPVYFISVDIPIFRDNRLTLFRHTVIITWLLLCKIQHLNLWINAYESLDAVFHFDVYSPFSSLMTTRWLFSFRRSLLHIFKIWFVVMILNYTIVFFRVFNVHVCLCALFKRMSFNSKRRQKVNVIQMKVTHLDSTVWSFANIPIFRIVS